MLDGATNAARMSVSDESYCFQMHIIEELFVKIPGCDEVDSNKCLKQVIILGRKQYRKSQGTRTYFRHTVAAVPMHT